MHIQWLCDDIYTLEKLPSITLPDMTEKCNQAKSSRSGIRQCHAISHECMNLVRIYLILVGCSCLLKVIDYKRLASEQNILERYERTIDFTFPLVDGN